jgi:hypothetical protein
MNKPNVVTLKYRLAMMADEYEAKFYVKAFNENEIDDQIPRGFVKWIDGWENYVDFGV